MKVYALVITYKNLDSLRKCLNRLFLQTQYIEKIVVLNNASNDGTEIYLTSTKEPIEVIHLEKNTGGAGGYYHGLKFSVEHGADWVWCVEDDILSSRNFVRNLKSVLDNRANDFRNVGFLYPKVLSIQNRNKLDGGLYFKQPNELLNNMQTLEKSQFAGCVINALAIKKVGLPFKEFFIYYDDWEYTTRMTDNGYSGLWLNEFFVWHNSYEVREIKPFLNRSKQEIWKNFYGIRNELYILRKRNFIDFMKPFLKNMLVIPFIILFNRNEDKLYVAFNWSFWTIRSLFIKVKIDFPKEN